MQEKFSQQLAILIWLFLFGAPNSMLHGDLGREIRPSSWKQDANIRDVFFIDDQYGWVVGDQGLIERTTNGGKDWIRCRDVGLDLDGHRTFEQKLSRMRSISQVHELDSLTCSFSSVHFIDRNRGWVAGNFYTPYLGTTRSIVLATDDGGKTWFESKGNYLPKINRIYFQDVLGGWALGNSGDLFKSGIFATASGGRNWSENQVKASRNWIDGELVPSGFVVIDDTGTLGRVSGSEFEPSVVFGKRPGKMRSIRMVNSKTGWAVGDRGTILLTTDSGTTWRRPKSIEENARLIEFDFTTVAVSGDRAWIAGNPGTYVIAMDAKTGEDFEFHSTRTSLPISKMYFSNSKIGCLVGQNGMISMTNDGGKNWKIRRLAGDRVAVLYAATHLEELPLANIAMHSSEANRLTAAILVGTDENQPIDFAEAALSRLGCANCMQATGDDLSSEKPQESAKEILRQLVRAIRVYQPNVLVCSPTQSNAEAAEFYVQCRAAIDMAADSEAYPKQLHDAGLSTWQVDRIMIREDKTANDIVFQGSRYLPRSGKLLEDHMSISRGLLKQSPVPRRPEAYRVESFTGSVTFKSHNIFYGLAKLGRHIPTRQEKLRLGNLNTIATAPLKRIEFNRMIAMPTDTENQMLRIKEQIRQFGTGQESRESGIWLMQLADQFLEQGCQFQFALLKKLIRQLHQPDSRFAAFLPGAKLTYVLFDPEHLV
ncbi:MAG: YCF48-related protein, partial [Planctomycetota bacterium]